MVAQGFERELNVGSGNGRAVRKLCFGADFERESLAIICHVDALGQQAIFGEGFCPIAAHQAFEHKGSRACHRIALDNEGVNAVKCSCHRLFQNAAFRRIWVSIRQVFEIGRKGRLAQHGHAVFRCCISRNCNKT